MSAGGDELNYSDVEFVDDKTIVQDQNPYQGLAVGLTKPIYACQSRWVF